MEGRRMKKKLTTTEPRFEDQARISGLPDDLIHRIMFFLDTREAVQTSILSKRWYNVWTTLPFLKFNYYNMHYKQELSKFIYSKFIDHVFSGRDHRSRMLTLDLCPFHVLDFRLIKKYVKYAISHDVETLSVKSERYCSLSMFSSSSLINLKLAMTFESADMIESDRWTLPNLAHLHLIRHGSSLNWKIPESCLTCLPALTTLKLKNCRLPEVFSLPSLTTLSLELCTLPQQVWNLPALLTLELVKTLFPKNMSEYFLALSSLRNLIIYLVMGVRGCVISCSQLVDLKIRAHFGFGYLRKYEDAVKIEVLAPKLCNFSAIGFFRVKFEGSELEDVNIKFWDCTDKEFIMWVEELKRNPDVFKSLFSSMFSQLGSGKILTLDRMTIQALSKISDILVLPSCPFNNLKYLKLPQGCEESSISSSLKHYLLGGSPRATIVKPLSQDDVIPQMAPAVSLTTQNVVLEEPLANLPKELIDSESTHKSTVGETVEVRVPKEHMVENSALDADKIRQIGASVAGARNDRSISSLDNKNLGLWQGHEVNSEFVGLLNLIMKRYPETFEQLPTENKKIWTMKLNMLCSAVDAFTKTSKSEVDTEILTDYRALFSELQRCGFNVNWLMSYLTSIEKLWFSKPLLQELHAIDSRIDDAKSKLQDLQTLRAEKMTGSESSPTMGTRLAVTAGYIGDDIL